MGHWWQANAEGFRDTLVALQPVTVFDSARKGASR